MISVLIPIYNQDVTELVSKIHNQITALHISFEILCFDDDSEKMWQLKNKSLSQFDSVNYCELSQNLGRSKIRNKLVRESSYKSLLFLDSDSKIISTDFIKTYLDAFDRYKIINGGRIYPNQTPNDESKILHYTYGIKKEAKPADHRLRKPALYFHTNNFIVDRELALAFPFPEGLTNHGYEDLAFATRLENNGIQIHHINNPVEHQDIVSTNEFLGKMEESSTSLVHLYSNQEIMKTPLIRAYEVLKRTLTVRRFISLYESNVSYITKNLHSAKPSMHYLDMFKLYHFCKTIES